MKQPDDAERLRHILDAAKEIVQLTRGRSRADLDADRLLTLAIWKLAEIIGEAAGRVSAPLRAQYPAIPWVDMISTRNRLTHGYHDINLNILWSTVTQDIPGIIPLVEDALTRIQGT